MRKQYNHPAAHQPQKPKIPIRNVGRLVRQNRAQAFFAGASEPARPAV